MTPKQVERLIEALEAIASYLGSIRDDIDRVVQPAREDSEVWALRTAPPEHRRP